MKRTWKFYDFKVTNRWKLHWVRPSEWVVFGFSIKEVISLQAKFFRLHFFGIDFHFAFRWKPSNYSILEKLASFLVPFFITGIAIGLFWLITWGLTLIGL